MLTLVARVDNLAKTEPGTKSAGLLLNESVFDTEGSYQLHIFSHEVTFTR